MFLPALLTGRMFDLGYFKVPLLCASILLVVATFLVPQCTEYWQFLLCQGFAVGVSAIINLSPFSHCPRHYTLLTDRSHRKSCTLLCSQISCGVIFGPVMGIISHWFKRRRSFALGIIACGSSIGGTLFPIAFRNLTVRVGYVSTCISYSSQITHSAWIVLCVRFHWTMRIFGFILIFTLGVANLVRVISPFIPVYRFKLFVS